jgi:Circularly permutated YpsA SLOG family
LLKVISGGQTGVDRGALDAALALQAECGGWCPEGRLAEDGTIPKRYPVVELSHAGYAERTARNVADSDGTLIIANGEPIGGTRETIGRCVEMDKPHRVIDCERMQIDESIELATEFVKGLSSRAHARNLPVGQDTSGRSRGPSHSLGMTVVLNVAGPRASQWRDGHQIAEQIVSGILRPLSGQNDAVEYSS